MLEDNDEYFMREAIEEAKKSKGQQVPNPAVGAVIVEGGEIIARGYHAKVGEAHAELNAINSLGRKAGHEARLYVTLEPCSSEGRTGPCTEAILESGLLNVIVGTIDPNPKHNGSGIDILRKAGISVRCGVLEKECKALNREFNERMSKLKEKL